MVNQINKTNKWPVRTWVLKVFCLSTFLLSTFWPLKIYVGARFTSWFDELHSIDGRNQAQNAVGSMQTPCDKL